MEQEELYASIIRLTRRMTFLMRDLELVSLTTAEVAGPLSKKQFPTKWYKRTNGELQKYTKEMRLISEKFTELFSEEIEAEEPIEELKKRKRK